MQTGLEVAFRQYIPRFSLNDPCGPIPCTWDITTLATSDRLLPSSATRILCVPLLLNDNRQNHIFVLICSWPRHKHRLARTTLSTLQVPVNISLSNAAENRCLGVLEPVPKPADGHLRLWWHFRKSYTHNGSPASWMRIY